MTVMQLLQHQRASRDCRTAWDVGPDGDLSDRRSRAVASGSLFIAVKGERVTVTGTWVRPLKRGGRHVGRSVEHKSLPL
jgi:hypothetical protein